MDSTQQSILHGIDDAMLALQIAVEKRCLYAPLHPQCTAALHEAAGKLEALTQQHGGVEVVALDDRVVAENATLPSSSLLTASLFALVRKHDVDRVVFTPGVSAVELAQLVELLADRHSHEPLRSTAHISFDVISLADPKVPDPDAAADHPVKRVWQELQSDGRQQTAQLHNAIMQVMEAVHQHSTALIALANIRSNSEYTYVHTTNVAVLSTALGAAVGLSNKTLEALAEAALLHDIGKTRIPDSILSKPGKLDPDERRIIESHPVIGAAMLINQPRVAPLAPIVAFEHHIRTDKTGYPKVGAHWRMNLASQITQIADIYDALRTQRSYRQALPEERALSILEEQIASGIDQDLLEIFEKRVICRITSGMGAEADGLATRVAVKSGTPRAA